MKAAVEIARFILVAAAIGAAIAGMIGFLVAYFGGVIGVAEGIGWGITIGGGCMALAVGESGSTTHMAATGVGRTSYSFVVSGMLMMGAGIALIIAAY